MDDDVSRRETPAVVFILVRTVIGVVAGIGWFWVARHLGLPELASYFGLAVVVGVATFFNFGMTPPRSGWR